MNRFPLRRGKSLIAALQTARSVGAWRPGAKPRAARLFCQFTLTLSAMAGISLPARGLPLTRHDSAGANAGDGVYGRFRGDSDWGLGLGAQHTQQGYLGQVQASWHYFSLSGAKLHYAENLGSVGDTARNFGLLAELKPLFLPRWIMGYQEGPAALDLLIDSLAVGIGPYWASEEATGDRQRGLQLGLSVGFPLAGLAPGPWLELGVINRWPDEGSRHLAFSAVLSWHLFHSSGLPR